MEDTKIATSLGQYISHEAIKVGKNNTPAIKVHYTRLDGDKKGETQSVQYLVGKLDEASKAVLKQASEEKGKMMIVKEKTPGSMYFNLKEFKSADEFVEKPASTWKGNGGGGGGYAKKEYDDSGVSTGHGMNLAAVVMRDMGLYSEKVSESLETLVELAKAIIIEQSILKEWYKNEMKPNPKAVTKQAVAQQSTDMDDPPF